MKPAGTIERELRKPQRGGETFDNPLLVPTIFAVSDSAVDFKLFCHFSREPFFISIHGSLNKFDFRDEYKCKQKEILKVKLKVNFAANSFSIK